MATLREYYNTDFSRTVTIDREHLTKGEGLELRAAVRLHLDHEANAFFASVFVPGNPFPVEVCRVVLAGLDTVISEKDQIVIHSGDMGAAPGDMMSSKDLRFTGRVFLYYDGELSPDQVAVIGQFIKSRQYLPVIRTAKYLRDRIARESPLAFISHDNRDKEKVARPLATALMRHACPVWYDEYSLKVGDRLRESIEKGLKECRRCILLVSKSFISNDGWTRAEFDSVFTREMLEQRDVILPVWCGVTEREVYEYSPSLANRFALKWESGEDVVVGKLLNAIFAANPVMG